MRVPDEDRARLEDLDDQRRRIYEEFNHVVQLIREGAVRDPERVRMEAQHLHVRHEGIIRDMLDLLVYY